MDDYVGEIRRNLIGFISAVLFQDYAERGDDNSLIIERILILIRNVLYVPADSMEKRPDNDASVHDQVNERRSEFTINLNFARGPVVFLGAVCVFCFSFS